METNQVETNKDVAIEHQDVPVAHQGLHNFLYNSDEEHAAEVAAATNLESNGAEVVSIDGWRSPEANAKVAGVYAVLDSDRLTQYISYSRNVLLSLNSHITQNGIEKCAFVRVQAFKFPKREDMENLRDEWLQKLDYIPPGNAGESGMWASTVGEAAKAVMSEGDRKAYEEKKLKLRTAMADTTLAKESENASDGDRSQNLNAVKNDDWSAIIDAQTQETK